MENLNNKIGSYSSKNRGSNAYPNLNDNTSEIELPRKNSEIKFTPGDSKVLPNSNFNAEFNQSNFSNNNNNNNTNNNNNMSNMLLNTSQTKMNEPLVNQEIAPNSSVPNYNNNTPVVEPISNELTQEIIKRKNTKIFGFYVAFHFFMLFFAAPMIVLVFRIRTKLKYSEYYYFHRIYNNWSKPPLSKITIDSCEQFENQLIQSYWEGTQSGCNCYSYVKNTKCSRRSACRNVAGISPIPISFWRGRRLCRESGDYYAKKTYFDFNVEKSPENCSTGTRSCGVIDTNGNHLCVETGIACPINSINFYSVIEYDKIKDSIPKDNEIIQLTNEYLVYGNNPNNIADINKAKIPIQYRVSNGQPCMNPYYENIPFPLYILDQRNGRQQCLKYADMSDNINNSTDTDTKSNNTSNDYSFIFYYNQNYDALDTISQEVLYTENGIAAKTLNLPLFSKDQYKHDISLYSTNYFGLKLSCFKDIKRKGLGDEVLDDLRKVAEISSMNAFYLQLFTIIYTIFFVVIFFMGISVVSASREKKTLRKIQTSDVYTYAFFAFIAQILIVLIIIFFFRLQTKVAIGNDFVKVFSDASCIDSFTSDLYMQLVPDILWIKLAAYWGISFGIVVVVLYNVFTATGLKYIGRGESIYYEY